MIQCLPLHQSVVVKLNLYITSLGCGLLLHTTVSYDYDDVRCAGVFDVGLRTGVIRNRVALTGFVGDHEMVVQAVDHGSPSLSNTAHVTITVLSSSQRPPDWIIPARDDFIKYIREVLAPLLCCSWVKKSVGITCHMRLHSVTCHPIQVNTPRLNASQTGRYSIYLSCRICPFLRNFYIFMEFGSGRWSGVKYDIFWSLRTSC